MFKRLVALALIIVTVFSCFTACGDDESVNVIYPISADPECLDPQIAENETAKLIVSNTMEGLVRLNENGEIIPGVAKEWEISNDGLTYTFTLREDAVWQMLRSHSKVLGDDYEKNFSTKVTAYDCAFGIERALRSETKAENAYLLYPIKNAEKFNKGEAKRDSLGVKVTNENTLIIQLDRAYPDLLRVLTEPMCMPCDEEFFNITGAKYGLELRYTLCNGPFYLGRWVDDGSLTLYRNENYKGYSSFKTDAVYLYVNSDEKQYISKLNQGDYNVASVLPENVSLVNDEAQMLTCQNGVYGFVFNCNDPVLDNVDMRKALINSMDISLISQDVTDFTLSDGVVPACCRWGNSSYREAVGELNLPEFNSSLAVKYFSKALKDDDITNINISIICPERFRTGIIRMIQKWEKIFGLAITVSVSALSDDELEKAVKKGEYQIAFTSLKSGDGNTLSFLDDFTCENENNIADFQDLKYDEMIENAKTKNQGDNIALSYKKCEDYLVSQGVFYPVFNSNSYIFVRESAFGAFGYAGFTTIDFALWSNKNEN